MPRIFFTQRHKVLKTRHKGNSNSSLCQVFKTLCLCVKNILVFSLLVTALTAQTASISVDARKVENRISPLLYGQFLEFMFEGVKRGLSAELIRDRSFEEPPNEIGLSRYWQRYPDDRNDDYALTFHWDDLIAYPEQRQVKPDSGGHEHSLRVETADGVIERHGIYQPRIAVRSGQEYQGYVWLRRNGAQGSSVTVALESDSDEHQVYAATSLNRVTSIKGNWFRYVFSLTPNRSDP